jgi:hypothetical protein
LSKGGIEKSMEGSVEGHLEDFGKENGWEGKERNFGKI